MHVPSSPGERGFTVSASIVSTEYFLPSIAVSRSPCPRAQPHSLGVQMTLGSGTSGGVCVCGQVTIGSARECAPLSVALFRVWDSTASLGMSETVSLTTW